MTNQVYFGLNKKVESNTFAFDKYYVRRREKNQWRARSYFFGV